METVLGTARDQVLAALEGIPEDELARWRTTEAHGDINTMYGLATHIVGSGEFWILEAAGGRDVHRQRLAEFTASGSLDDLRARFDRLLADTHEVLGRLTEDDLKKSFRRDAAQSQGIGAVERTVAECLVHALTHIALHLGHLQIQRQLWEQERGQG
jgi:uncharacterized damage-inducible protein DinB